MSGIYLSAYCVDFRDYELLRKMLIKLSEWNVGVEFGTSWKHPEFDQQLEAQIGRFDGVPVTIHAPFGESCCLPGTEEYVRMQQKFDKAFRWYHAFGASSMVMHTHKRKVSAEEKMELQAVSERVIMSMAERARMEGVNLTVENVGFRSKGSELYDQEEFIHLFERLPEDVGALIDTGHAMVNGWDIPDVIRRLEKRIRGLHLHNNDGLRDLHRPIFEKDLAYSEDQMVELLLCVKENCPDADLILEYAPSSCINTELFERNINRMRSCLFQQNPLS